MGSFGTGEFEPGVLTQFRMEMGAVCFVAEVLDGDRWDFGMEVRGGAGRGVTDGT